MDILIKPDKLSLSGSMNHLVMNSVKDVSLVLKQDDTGAVILQHTYSPDNLGRIEVDLGDVISPLLSFSLKDVSEVYEQTAIIRSFTIEATELGTEVPTSWTFSVIRAGIDHFSDSASNFLQANFLTWQPTVKPVTYYTPEFLTYYSAVDTKVCCKSYVSKDNAYTETLVTLSMLTAGKVWTIPVQYAVIASKVNALPAYYDVWVETTDGTRLTYIQRYYASDLLSEQEQWVLFENSLGGIDTFRAYGLSENTAKHTHNIAEIEQDATEYRVDTEREYKKSTGNLGKYERRWLLDFFPSLGKYVYADTFIRRIVVTDSDVTYRSTDLPSSYTFTYRYADARPYLNLARNSQPLDSGSLLAIEVPDVGSFTIAPRLVEFERLSLSSGALFPVQGPYADHWSVTTIASIIDYLSSELLSAYKNDGSLGHTHANISVLSALSRIGQYLLLDGSKINAGLSDQATGLTKDSPEWDKILRKDIPNNAQELITFLKGIAFGDGSKGIDAGGNATLARIIATELSSPNFLSSLYNGLGWRMDENGVLECDGIKVRSSMEIMELIINRLGAIEGDLILTEGDTIEAVTEIVNGDGSITYRLKLKSKWEGYYTAQVENNVLKGIINTLSAGSGEYHTSWMRVLSVDTTNNTIDVNLYPDVETPAGTNYAPTPKMNISRWGNATDTTRQSCIYLSSTEGRIVKLAHVTKPIIDKGNYGFVLGDMPDWLKDNTAISLKPGVDYVYLGGLIYDDLIHVPYQGKQDPVFVDRGQWTSTPSEPYHCETRNSLTGVYETSDVWHLGCKFRCIVDNPTSEPKWNSTDWAMIEGNPAFWIEIDSSKGDYFDVENFATTLSIVAWIYNQEVTSDILDADVVWERYTEDSTGTQRTAADASWNSNHLPSKTLALTREDIGIDSAGMPSVLRFKATATLRDGLTSTAEIIY